MSSQTMQGEAPGWARGRPSRGSHPTRPSPRRTRTDEVSATRLIDASPQRLWRMVSDVTRMGEWSTEAGTGRWIGRHRGPAIGARFVGTNRRGWRRWATTCRVVESEPGVAFAFDVKGGPFRIARWTYRFEHEGNRTRVTETWTDHRGHLMRWAGRWVSGVRDRAAHNRETMVSTLNGLARAAGPG